jgi:hypothetical protein
MACPSVSLGGGLMREADAIKLRYVRSASSGEKRRSSASGRSHSIALMASSDLASIVASRRCNALFLICSTAELSLLENFQTPFNFRRFERLHIGFDDAR